MAFAKGHKINNGRKHTATQRKERSQRCQGKNNPNYKGRRKCLYIQIQRKDHPYADKLGYVYLHRLIVEAIIGRYLPKEQEVHHLDENKLNNNPANLMLFSSKSAHKHYEYHGWCNEKDILFDGRFL